jgi:hypothetical protein
VASWLTELDRTRDELREEFPDWQIWYVPHSQDRDVTWCAKPKPLINAESPEQLRTEITQAQKTAVT